MLRYNTLHHRTQLEELFYGIIATGNKSQTAQQRIIASNNPPNPNPNDDNDTNTPDNELDDTPDDTPEDVPVEEGDSSNNQGSSCNTPGTQAISKRTRSAREDQPPSKRAKITGGHVLADSIVAVVEEMRASRKDRATSALELIKTQAKVAKELYESQVKLARTTTEKAVRELIDRYAEEEELLIQGLELMKDEQSVLIFISLTKVPTIQKKWLVAECNKSKN